jgi:predicted nucleotide-binding protein
VIPLNNIEILEELINEFKKISYHDEEELDYLLKKSDMVIRNIFGPSSKYLIDINSILLYPYDKRAATSTLKNIWNKGIKEIINLHKTMIDEINFFGTPHTRNYNQPVKNRAFIVHGHDVEMKESVARFLEKIEFEAIILGEKPNLGRTVIEKFFDYSDVHLAIILFSPDDIGGAINEDLDKLKPRPRQNVILELGFFLGTLDRTQIILIYKDMENFEIPSDLRGVLYINFDPYGGWKTELCRELNGIGYEINLNKITKDT